MPSLHVLSFHSDCISPSFFTSSQYGFFIQFIIILQPLLFFNSILLLLLPSCHQLHFIFVWESDTWLTDSLTGKEEFVYCCLFEHWLNQCVLQEFSHMWESQKETHCCQIKECSTCEWDTWTEHLHQAAEGGSVLWAFCTCCWSSSVNFLWFQQTVLMSWGLLLSLIYSSFDSSSVITLTFFWVYFHSLLWCKWACISTSHSWKVMLCEPRNCEGDDISHCAW
jgi:hypothetical protein